MLLSSRFGFMASPFRLNFPLREVFAYPSWERIQRDAVAAVARGERVVVIGETGTGKTLLLQALGESLRARQVDVRQVRPGDALAPSTAAEVLLVDEADLLDADALGRIGRLPNPVIMAGLPGLAERAPRPHRVERLERLGPQDIARFVRARLGAAQAVHPGFAPQAVLAIMRQSGGLFRLVTILAGAALFLAKQRGSSEVTAADVDEAASLRAGALEPPEDVVPHPTDEPVAEPAPADAPRWRPGRRTRTLAGWTGWLGASAGVVMLAIVAARATIHDPPVAEIVGLSPVTAVSAPGRPQVLALAAAPLPATATPEPTMANLPSTPELLASPSPVTPPSPLPSPLPSPPASPAPLAAAAPPESRPAPARDAERAPAVLVFSGPITNDTMGQTGQLSLRVMPRSAGGPVGAIFHASRGLIGTGVLNGTMGPNGTVRLEGKLMMGRNEFSCELSAILQGDRLLGEATFTHLATGAPAHSRFTLSKL